MKRETQLGAFLTFVGLALLAFALLPSVAAAAQGVGPDTNNGDDDRNGGGFAVPQGPGTNTGNCPAQPRPTDRVIFPRVYCPYPPGLIPSDLTTESERVRREIRGIEQEAMAQAAALGPLMPTSPAQTLAGNGLRAVQILG
jgi:hypothetical protein